MKTGPLCICFIVTVDGRCPAPDASKSVTACERMPREGSRCCIT